MQTTTIRARIRPVFLLIRPVFLLLTPFFFPILNADATTIAQATANISGSSLCDSSQNNIGATTASAGLDCDISDMQFPTPPYPTVEVTASANASMSPGLVIPGLDSTLDTGAAAFASAAGILDESYFCPGSPNGCVYGANATATATVTEDLMVVGGSGTGLINYAFTWSHPEGSDIDAGASASLQVIQNGASILPPTCLDYLGCTNPVTSEVPFTFGVPFTFEITVSSSAGAAALSSYVPASAGSSVTLSSYQIMDADGDPISEVVVIPEPGSLTLCLGGALLMAAIFKVRSGISATKKLAYYSPLISEANWARR